MVVIKDDELTFRIVQTADEYKDALNLIIFHQLHNPDHIGSQILFDLRRLLGQNNIPKELARRKTVTVDKEKITFPFTTLTLLYKANIPIGIIHTSSLYTGFFMKEEERKKGYIRRAWNALLKHYEMEKVKFKNISDDIKMEPFFQSLGNVRTPIIESEKRLQAFRKKRLTEEIKTYSVQDVVDIFSRIPGVTVTSNHQPTQK